VGISGKGSGFLKLPNYQTEVCTLRNPITKEKTMKIFWWQAGLHVEPESQEERAALMAIWSGVKKTSLHEMFGTNGQGSTSILVEQIKDSLIANHQMSPSSSILESDH
jgi:hypothetical protein